MATSLSRHMMSALPELRYQTTPKRVRVQLGAEHIVDTDKAVLIWEPRRVVASYAIPESDISATLAPEAPGPEPEYRSVGFGPDSPPLLDPSVPFAVHTAAGRSLTVEAGGQTREGAAFRLDDPDLTGLVILDFDAFDWWEEDEPIIGHARDPFHRIDVRRTGRRIRIEHDGVVLAESDGARALFEGTFPLIRYYLPASDVQVELTPGTLHTTCAYKGHATHYTAMVGGTELTDIAWSYPEPLPDAAEVAGMVAFYQERLDVFIDGEPVERVRTPWS